MVFFVLPLATVSFAQLPSVQTKSPVPEAVTYENQQRAHRLLAFEDEIKTLPDVEIRCQLRLEILNFIYNNDVTSEYPAAEPVLTEFFEEIEANAKAFENREQYLKNNMALLLRKHNPETARRIEAKYVPKVDTSHDDYEELRKNGNPVEIADREIARILSTKEWGNFLNIYETARRKDPELGSRMLNAAFQFAEETPGSRQASYIDSLVVSVLNPPPPTLSPEQIQRYYRIILAEARMETAEPIPAGTYVRTVWPLRRAMSKMKDTDPKLYAEGRAIFAHYRKLISKEQLAKEEADDRIEASEDNKLERAIAEAGSASGLDLKDYLWNRASQIASIKKDYKQAADLLLKASPTLGLADRPNARDETLANIAYWASSSRLYDEAFYAIGLIKDDRTRADALLQYAYDFGRWNEKDRAKAIGLTNDAMTLIEKVGPSSRTSCWISNSRHIMTIASRTVPLNDLVARGVRIVNVATPDSIAAQANSEPVRRAFLMNMMTCTADLFRPIMDSSPIPDPNLANQINVKEWRLAAQIEAEKHRRYPLAR